MFILDSLMIAGLRWILDTTRTAAESEMNDDTALREQLLEAEMRRELGEISDEEFREVETDLLARIREIRERREGSGPLALGAGPMEAPPGATFQVETELSGDFHEPEVPATPAPAPARRRRAAAARKRSPSRRTRQAGPSTRRTYRSTRSTKA